MRIAIPLFGDEVSPRFGCATRFLLVDVEARRPMRREVKDLVALGSPPGQLAAFLQSLAVNKVVCGGLHARFRRELEALGIEVIWGVIGAAEEAVSAFVSGRLERDQFLCRGGRGRTERRRRRARCRRPSALPDIRGNAEREE